LLKNIEAMKNYLQGKFKKQVGTTLLTQLIGLVFSITTSVFIARWLGPEGKGIITMALLVPGMMVIFLNSGIGIANVYFAGSRQLNVSALEANSISFAFIGTALGGFILIGLFATGWIKSLVREVPPGLILLAMVGLPFGLLCGYFSTILQGLQRIVAINIVNLAQGIVTLALTLLLVVWFKIGVAGAVSAYLLAGLSSLIMLGLFLRQEGGEFISKWEPAIMRSTLSFGLKGQIGNILQFFNYRFDMFIVNYFLGPGDVGIYSISVGLAELLWHFPNAVGFVIFPKAASTKPEVMNIFTPRVFRITLGLTALGAVGLIFLGKPIIFSIYSSTFLPAYVPMLALLPGVVFLGSAKVLTNEIAGRGYPHYNSINAGLALVLTVILDLMLIPQYGVLGAALASSIAYMVIFFVAIGFYLGVSRRKEELLTSKTLVEKWNPSPPPY
jgi:O-antigen/teichoic acid export membrane protein